MKGNINPFSGDKQYQTDFTLRFKLAKIEEAYTQDIYNRNQYNLIFLCIFSIFLIILSYFSNSCNVSSPECTHQFLLILNMLTIFLTIVLISRKNSIQPLIFLINGLYPYMKIFEEFEGRVPFILITSHLTVLAYYLIYSWRKVVLFEVFGYLMIYFYLKFHDYFLIEALFKNFGFILLTIGVSVFVLFLNEKTNKEKWVLFDSFKKSERLLEFLIDEFNLPIFLIDCRQQIQLSNFQALNLLQQTSGNPNPVAGAKKIFGKGKGMAQNRSFQELFPQENSQNSIVANAIIGSVLSGGKNYSCGVLKLNLFKSNPNQDNEPEIGQSSQLIAEEQLFELVCQGFIWKGIKCALIGLKEERNFQIHSLFNDQMIGKSLNTLMELIFAHSMEERYYYDSLMQNTTLMEANKFLYSRLYHCHAHIFYTLLMKNFILNNFEKLTLEGEHFYQNFMPFELLGTITHILKKNTDENDVILEVVEFEKSLLKLEKNYSNFSGGIAGESEKNSPFLRNPPKSNSEEMEKAIPVYGPCHMFQHIIITLLKSVMKIQLCKRFALSFRLEKPESPINQSSQDPSNISFLHKTSSIIEKNSEEDHVLRIDITFEEFSEPGKHLPNNNNMLVGDILSSTFKEQKKVKEYLEDIMKKDKSFIEADRDASFLYFQNKKCTSLGVFFLPYMIKALDASFKIIHEEEYNKTSTRFILVSPIKLKKLEDFNEQQGEKSINRVLGYSEKKSAVFPNNNQEKKNEESSPLKKKPKVFTQIKEVFAFEFFNKSKDSQTRINEKKEESKEDWGSIKRSNSKDLREELISNSNFNIDSFKNPQRMRPSPLETIESATNSNSNSNRISSVSPKRKSPLKNPPGPVLTIKKNEIYIEEELKKYLYHMQNGFTATVEHILNEILNEESTKGAHIIFPPKNYLFQEKENSRNFNNHEKNNIPMPKKSPNSIRGKIKRLPSEDKEDVSSFLFTESGRTESMLTGKSNDDELLLNADSEPNSVENNSFPKENPHTRSNQLQPRTILRNEGNNGLRRGPIFRSPNLLRSKLEEKHVLVGGESLMKYLKTATFNSVGDSTKDIKAKEKKLDLDSLREKSTQIRMSSRASDVYKQKDKKDIRKLTYTRQWVVCNVKGEKKIVTEINCAMFRQDPEPPSFDTFPKEAKKIFMRKPTKRPKSIVSDKDRISDTLEKRQKQKSVLNKIKNFTKLDNFQKFEEIKQEDESPKRKNIGKYIEILKNLTFKEKPTILAYDSESQLNDPNRCKGIKSLALKVGHDYKFELCPNGVQIIKNYKSFILKSNIYHIIIIELEMLQLTGWKCVKKIRNFEAKYKPKHRSFIVGLLNDDERNYEVYVRWGFDEFLRKPFDSNLFEEILKRRIDEIRKGEELVKINNSNNNINGEQKDTQIIASSPPSSELDWLREMVKPVAETGREAIYQKEPILMMAIDDNYFILMGISNLKLKVKYKMEIAKSGKLGLETYKNFLSKRLLFQIIFIDIEMPDMDGLEVTRLLRAIESEFNLKRSFICGLITDENNKFDVYHEQGMDEFLKKPVNVQVLNEMLERRLQQIESEQNQRKLEILPILEEEKKEENLQGAKNDIPKLLDFEVNFPINLREKATFLSIDDNDFILLGISHIKIEIEYKMEICKSGALGLAKFKDFLKNKERYHAIFLDIDMPLMTGLEVAHEIRKIENQYNLPHTFICGLITDENKDFDAYVEAGMNEFLKKPVNPKSLNLILPKIIPVKQEIPPIKLTINEKPNDVNKEAQMKDNVVKLKFKPQVTLLAVDDNDFILMGISHLKLEFQFKMDICKNGALALEKYNAMKAAGFIYHAIFMDIDMPVMNGLECTSKIREMEKNQQALTYVFGLINDDYKDVEKYLEAGMNEFLNKPVNPKSMNLVMKKRLEDIQKIQQAEEPVIIKEKTEEKKDNAPKQEIKCREEITILAVDDNDFILMGISHLRGVDIKYKMEVCKNGKLALEKYYKMLDTHCIYHIIFMDIEMPEMNGMECTKKIREFEKAQNIPRTHVIGLINDDYKDIEKYLEVGMDEFINKPVNPQAFSAIVKKQMAELAAKSLPIKKEGEIDKNNDQKLGEQKLPRKNLAYSQDIILLAIDDNDFILLGMSHLRLEMKYKMEIAKSGKKGFEKYQETLEKGLVYHAIFIDIDMPEISGLQLTTMIREYEKKQGFGLQSYIVGLITDENKDIEQYLEVGMNEFLNKPVHPKTMNEILGRRLANIKEKEEKPISAIKG